MKANSQYFQYWVEALLDLVSVYWDVCGDVVVHLVAQESLGSLPLWRTFRETVNLRGVPHY